MVSPRKHQNRLIQLKNLKKVHTQCKKNGTLDYKYGKQILNEIKILEEKILEHIDDVKELDASFKNVESKSCIICGFPITKVLGKHHVIYSDERNVPLITVCKNCHKVIHYCEKKGCIDEQIRDYYSSLDGALKTLEMYVNVLIDSKSIAYVIPQISTC
jgi:hypothetical protein